MSKLHPLDVRNSDPADRAAQPWNASARAPAPFHIGGTIGGPIESAPDRTDKRARAAGVRAAEKEAERSVGWLRYVWGPAAILAQVRGYKAGQQARGNSPLKSLGGIALMSALYLGLMKLDGALGMNQMLGADPQMITARADQPLMAGGHRTGLLDR